MSQTPGSDADPGCIDCGWRPAPGALWPTEGPLAVRWMERFLICAEGDWFGKPLQLRTDQKRFVYRWYESCPACGYWRYDEALRGAATGDGKTTFVAGLECLEMFGPPQIAPVSPNIINAAASFEQADLLFNIAGVMLGGRDQAVAEAPLCGYAEVYDTEIKYADGRPGIMKRVAAVAGTNEGGLPSLFIGDELHEWGDVGSTKARVHMVIGKSTRKRRMICRMPDGREVTRGPGRKLGISTAGFDVDHTLLGAMYKHGQRALLDPSVAPRLLFDWREARAGLDYTSADDRRTAVRDASAAAGVLWDIEGRVREWDNPAVEHHEWIRYYANSWVAVAADSWLKDHPAAWAKCQGQWELAGDEPAILAIDMALKRDSVSVRELVKLHDDRVATTNRTWYPADGRIDHLEVWDHIKETATALGPRFRGLVYDPRFFELPARLLEEEGFLVIEFNQSPQQMAPACGMAFDMIIHQRIVHADDPDEARQVLAAVKREAERGFTLSKGKSRIHIDAAITLCMGVDALARLTKEIDILNTMW
jgi:phage terminase large subunit-like protein